MSKKFTIDENATNIPSEDVFNDDSHLLEAEVDVDNRDIYLTFTTRESMRDFALGLLHASEFGTGDIELYPLIDSNGKRHVVDGVRLSDNSSRVFIRYPIAKNT